MHQKRWSCCWKLSPCRLLLWGQPQVSASTLASRFCSAEQRDEEVSAGTMHVEQSSDPSDLGVVLENASSPPRKINNPQPPHPPHPPSCHLKQTSFLNLFIFGCAGCLLLRGLVSSCNEWGPLSCGLQASHSGDFLRCRAQALECVGSVVEAPGF